MGFFLPFKGERTYEGKLVGGTWSVEPLKKEYIISLV